VLYYDSWQAPGIHLSVIIVSICALLHILISKKAKEAIIPVKAR